MMLQTYKYTSKNMVFAQLHLKWCAATMNAPLRNKCVMRVSPGHYTSPSNPTVQQQETVVFAKKSSNANSYPSQATAPPLNDTTIQNDEDDVMDIPTPSSEWPWQLLVFILNNGFSIFFAIMILMSFFAQRNAMKRQSQFFNNKAKTITAEDIKTTFADVAGCESAKLELQEVVDFLKHPEKYTKMGAKIPKGCLLTGGPGLGKTLLARAVAGEAGVPFFACSASEFIELFVGVGSARVRDLFKQAKEAAPCIIFIDEIDAIGKSRSSAGSFAANDEREQTINQMLTEMDGFADNKGIVVMAATNRPDILDKALVRPGRFDRQIVLDPPSKDDRLAILKIHCMGKPIDVSFDLGEVANMTVGFSGAELAMICNEAAILAARNNKESVGRQEFNDAIDRVMLGPARKRMKDLDHEKKLVAYHEAGHATVALLLDPSSVDKVTKISIIPRGRTGGVTVFEPLDSVAESGLATRTYLENKLVIALGGRVAEELVYGEELVTVGASNDMEMVQSIARSMVTSYGFGSSDIGNVGWSTLGAMNMSAYMQTRIDREVVKLAEEAYNKAKQLLLENEGLFSKLASELYVKEVLASSDIETILDEYMSKQPRGKLDYL